MQRARAKSSLLHIRMEHSDSHWDIHVTLILLLFLLMSHLVPRRSVIQPIWTEPGPVHWLSPLTLVLKGRSIWEVMQENNNQQLANPQLKEKRWHELKYHVSSESCSRTSRLPVYLALRFPEKPCDKSRAHRSRLISFLQQEHSWFWSAMSMGHANACRAPAISFLHLKIQAHPIRARLLFVCRVVFLRVKYTNNTKSFLAMVLPFFSQHKVYLLLHKVCQNQPSL